MSVCVCVCVRVRMCVCVCVTLGHAGVDVEGRVTQFGYLLGQQLNTIGRVAEDDGLIDVELVEQRVEAPDLWAWLLLVAGRRLAATVSRCVVSCRVVSCRVVAYLGWVVGWLVGWLALWVVGWLVGRLVCVCVWMHACSSR